MASKTIKTIFREYDRFVKQWRDGCYAILCKEGVVPEAITYERKPGPPGFDGVGLPSHYVRGGATAFKLVTSFVEPGKIVFESSREEMAFNIAGTC